MGYTEKKQCPLKTEPQMEKRLTPFLRVIRELHELRELEAAKQLF
jgi:hypothetical protein